MAGPHGVVPAGAATAGTVDTVHGVGLRVPPAESRRVIRMTQHPIHLCIGAPRAGTTWLYSNLARQRSVFTPPVKEVRYWSGRRRPHQVANVELEVATDDLPRAHKGWLERWHAAADPSRRPSIAEYLELMAVPDRPSIDISPIYSLLKPRVARRLADGLPAGSRVLYIVRNPLARTLSHIKLRYYLQERGAPDAEELDAFFGDPRQLRRNDYATVIRQWRKCFGDHFAYLAYDHLEADPAGFLRRAAEHLGVQLESHLDEDALRTRYWTDTLRPAPTPTPELRRRVAQAVMPYVEDFADVDPDLAERWCPSIEAALQA